MVEALDLPLSWLLDRLLDSLVLREIHQKSRWTRSSRRVMRPKVTQACASQSKSEASIRSFCQHSGFDLQFSLPNLVHFLFALGLMLA